MALIRSRSMDNLQGLLTLKWFFCWRYTFVIMPTVDCSRTVALSLSCPPYHLLGTLCAISSRESPPADVSGGGSTFAAATMYNASCYSHVRLLHVKVLRSPGRCMPRRPLIRPVIEYDFSTHSTASGLSDSACRSRSMSRLRAKYQILLPQLPRFCQYVLLLASSTI